jgi:hypothetical protein
LIVVRGAEGDWYVEVS